MSVSASTANRLSRDRREGHLVPRHVVARCVQADNAFRHVPPKTPDGSTLKAAPDDAPHSIPA